MIWVDLIVLALAVSRVTRLIVSDSITERLRNWVWYRFPASDTRFGDSEVTADGKDHLGYRIGHLATHPKVHVFRTSEAWHPAEPRFVGNLISCAWCAGVWVAIAGWVGYFFYPDLVYFAAPLALAEITGLLNARS